MTKSIEGVIFGFGLKRADLLYRFRGCVPNWGTRLGQDNKNGFIVASGECWHIHGPIDPSIKVLKGNPLGYEALCRVRALSGSSTLGVWLSINAYKDDMRVFVRESGEEPLAPNKRVIVEQFIKECLFQEDGSYELSNHGLVYGASE